MTPEEYVGKWEFEAGREGMLEDLRAMLREERIKTLEEAADATCPDCRAGVMFRNEWNDANRRSVHLHYYGTSPCEAFPVHRLITKEKEAQGG